MNRILIVDDDSLVRDFLRRCLEKAGYWVRVAEDGHEAIQIARKCRPDMVITDLVMPGKAGYETIVELRERFPMLPLLAVSGFAGRGLEAALTLGATHCLAKPFTADELTTAVAVTFQQVRAAECESALNLA